MNPKLIIKTEKIPICSKCKKEIIGDRYTILNKDEIYHNNCIN
jgi:hypothetical protein